LYEWDTVDIVLAEDDRARFSSIYDLARDVKLHGYYGGIRLIKATIKRFVDYCDKRDIHLHDRNFSVRYETFIPRQVGLGGSSAIITATLRCLMEYYGVEIPREVATQFGPGSRKRRLGHHRRIAGSRDPSVTKGLLYMDFAQARECSMDGYKCYTYEPLDPALLPPLYVAYSEALSEPTEVFHNDIRGRTIAAMNLSSTR